MNDQARTALNVFTDFYGEPKWMREPKDGQNPESIIDLWCSELKDYTIEQIRQACAWITRKRRVMTFPTLDVLLCELSDKEKVVDEKSESQLVLEELLNHQPPFDEDVIQRVMWMSYRIKYKDYDPNSDKLLDDQYKTKAEEKQPNELTGYGHLIKKI